MSAIAGVFSRSGRPRQPDEVQTMLELMDRRGPDRRAVHRSGAVTLGHGLLAATPEAAREVQPFLDPRTGCAVVADVRLDNRAALHATLDLRNRPLHGIGDAELLLAAYHRWGPAFVGHLLGDFALAVWDPNRQRLTLARDHFGVRPLQYFLTDDVLVFASDARAIRLLPEVPSGLNRDRLIDLFVPQLETCDVTATPYEAISRLTPAHTFEITSERTETTQYWELVEPDVLSLDTDGEFVEAHDAVFGEAVRCRQRGRDDHAVMLSGGIDSAAIAVQEVGHHGGPGTVGAYSAISLAGEDLETRLINQTVDHLGLKHHAVMPDDFDSLCGTFADHVGGLESPFDAAMNMMAAVCAVAASEGVRSLSAGTFANELAEASLGDLLRIQLRQRHFGAALRQFHPDRTLAPDLNRRQLARMLAATALSGSPFDRVRKGRRAAAALAAVQEAVNEAHLDLAPDDLARIEERYLRCRVPRFPDDGPGSARTRLFASHYATAGLERYDRIAAAQSVELRSPFMDKRVVEFWLSLPPDQLIKRGWPKFLLRRACAPHLPVEIVWNRANEHLGAAFTASTVAKQPPRPDVLQAGHYPLSTIVDQSIYSQVTRRVEIDTRNGRIERRDFDLIAASIWIDND